MAGRPARQAGHTSPGVASLRRMLLLVALACLLPPVSPAGGATLPPGFQEEDRWQRRRLRRLGTPYGLRNPYRMTFRPPR
jgi:hypothetical protein